MFRLDEAILVEEAPQVVWAFLANLPVSLTCHRRRRAFRWLSEPQPGPGSRYQLEQRILGVAWRQEGRVTRWEPPLSLALAHWTPRWPRWGFGHQLRLAVQPVEERALEAWLSSTVIGRLGPWYAEPLLRLVVRRSMRQQLQALKVAIESTDKGDSAQQSRSPRLAEVPAAGLG